MASDLGVGVGLREEHLEDILHDRVSLSGIDWFEFITEEVMVAGGRWISALDKVRKSRPVGLHGLFAGLGNAHANPDYEAKLVELVQRVEPALLSDHLCWSAWDGTFAYDLLPLPYTKAAVERVVVNIQRLQDKLQRRLLIENTSVYVSAVEHEMSELEFVQQVLARADCDLLLDVNNVVVNAKNLGFSAEAFVDGLDAARIRQVHLAGHTDRGAYLYDTHVGPVPDVVWRLYERVLRRTGPVSTLIEWDAMVPPFDVLVAEAERARQLRSTVKSTPDVTPPPDVTLAPVVDETLTSFQRQFWAAMRGGESSLPSSPGLDAYRELFRGRRIDQLLVDYGALGTHLGEASFMELAERFVDMGIGREALPRSLSDDFFAFLQKEDLDDFARGLAGLDCARSQLLVEVEYTACGAFEVASHRFVQLPDVLVLMWRRGDEVVDRATSSDEQQELQRSVARQSVPDGDLKSQWEAEGIVRSR